MGNIFGTQKKNSLQPNAQPSVTQPTLARRDALAVCSPWRRGSTDCARRRAQSHKSSKNASANSSQTMDQKWYPKLEPKVVPKIGTTTRTLVHCYLKTNYAREDHQNMSPNGNHFRCQKQKLITTQCATECDQNGNHFWYPAEELITTTCAAE